MKTKAALLAAAVSALSLVGPASVAKAECSDAEIPFKNQDAPTAAEYGFIYQDETGATRINPANGPDFLVAFVSFYGTGNAEWASCQAGPVTDCILGIAGALHPTEYVYYDSSSGEIVIDDDKLQDDLASIGCPIT